MKYEISKKVIKMIIRTIKIERTQWYLVQVLFLAMVFCYSTSWGQIKSSENEEKVTADWIELEKSLSMFPTKEISDSFKKLSYIEKLKFQDAFKLRSIVLAEKFWNTYLQDERRFDAMSVYLGANPDFIENISGELQSELEKIPNHEWKQISRRLPFDKESFDDWNYKGQEMVKQVITSDASIQKKEIAEWKLFARDFRRAGTYFKRFFDRKETDNATWFEMDAIYWSSFQMLFDAHAIKYAELPILADRARDFLAALNSYSPLQAEKNWWHIINNYKDSTIHTKSGIQALLNAANERIELLGVESGDKPMEIKFTAIDGRKVNTSELKGKVVLIDFWASWCKPCIKEIPYLKEMYEKYHRQGFEIIGIALDEESLKDTVVNIINKFDLRWPQMFEGKGFYDDSLRLSYSINALPTAYFLDKNGKLVNKEARGENLEILIRKYLNLD